MEKNSNFAKQNKNINPFTFINNSNSLIFIDIDEKIHLEYIKNINISSKIFYFDYDKNIFYNKNNDNINFCLIKNFYLILIKSNKTSESSFFISKVISFLKEIENQKNNFKFLETSFIKNNRYLNVLVRKESETIDLDILLQCIKVSYCSRFFFYRNENDTTFPLVNFIKKNIYQNELNNDDKNILKDIKLSYNNNELNIYKNSNIVIQFLDKLIEMEYIVPNLKFVYGLIDYGNVFYNCNLYNGKKCNCSTNLFIKNEEEEKEKEKCKNNKINHLNEFYHLQLKILEYYIKKDNNKNISHFSLSCVCLKEFTKNIEYIGDFLYKIKNKRLDLNLLISLDFINSWDILLDGISILKKIIDNSQKQQQEQKDSIFDDVHLLSLKKYIPSSLSSSSSKSNKDNYLNYDLIIKNKNHSLINLNINEYIKSRLNPKYKMNIRILNISLYLKNFIELLIDNNFLFFNEITVKFFDKKKSNECDIENYFKKFVEFLDLQNNIRKLYINSDYYKDGNLIDLCNSLYSKELKTLILTYKEYTVDDIEFFIEYFKKSTIEYINISKFFLIDKRIDKIHVNYSKIIKDIINTPVQDREIPLKTNVKSANKRFRDDEYNDNFYNGSTKFLKKE